MWTSQSFNWLLDCQSGFLAFMWLSFNDDEVVDDYNGDYSRFKSLKQTIIKIITMIKLVII